MDGCGLGGVCDYIKSFWLPHQRSVANEDMLGGLYSAGENTGHLC